MNEKQEKQFETRFSTAVIGFATQLQSIMEVSSEELTTGIVEKYDANPDMSIDEMMSEIATHVVKNLVEEFGLQVKNYEIKS